MQVMEAAKSAETSFRAFLSYCHADKAEAQRLHRKLEAYRLPRYLRKNGTKSRIGKVFRDREDLPAATDLSASVQQALAISLALIVLCSPDAKSSRWVAREIELFREMHPDRPILVALLRGEPEASLPDQLSRVCEPLAADLRRDGDGYRLGFLKLVAGLVSVPLDALVQRDSQRQIRRVTAVTGIVATVAIAMGVMTLIALEARSEARWQQAEAEGLIEYMLTDLREDLDGAAGLAVMSRVNRRALAYYEGQQSLTTLSPESLERRARVIGRLGEDAILRKDYGLARRNLEERARTTLGLLNDDPSDLERRLDHASSLNRLAILADAEGNGGQAETDLRASWALLSGFRACESGNAEWRRTTALVAGNLCAIDILNTKVDEQTLEKCWIAVDLERELAAHDNVPSRTPHDLAFNLMWYSVALQQAAQPDEARKMRAEALRLTDTLAAQNPDNRKIVAQRMEIYGYLAGFEPRPTARAMLRTAKGIAEELTQLDTERASWKSSLDNFRSKLEE